jgi:hypothetical protein
MHNKKIGRNFQLGIAPVKNKSGYAIEVRTYCNGTTESSELFT